jgi:Cu(I)/Ag(I) efflux system membrane fusion protein
MPGRFWQNAKNYASKPPNKVTVLWFSNAQIESIKARNKFRHTLLYSTYSGYISSGYRRQLCDGRAAIIKLAALSTLWLESQVNVSNAKSLKIGQRLRFLYGLSYQEVEATISFINPEINLDSRLLLIRMEIANPNLLLKPGMQAVTKLTQSNRKVYLFQ